MTIHKQNFAPIELKSAEEGDPADIVTKALDELKGSVGERLEAIEKKTSDRMDRIFAS